MNLNEFIQTQYMEAMERAPKNNNRDYEQTKNIANSILDDLAGNDRVAEKVHYQNLLGDLSFYDERRAFEIGFKTALRHLNMLHQVGE